MIENERDKIQRARAQEEAVGAMGQLRPTLMRVARKQTLFFDILYFFLHRHTLDFLSLRLDPSIWRHLFASKSDSKSTFI